jgi:Sulfatase
MASPVDTVREVLPIPDRRPVSLTTYDAKDPDTRFPPIRPLRPPAGAPNVLVILLDDVGFGASSAFGGPCQTPNAERLAKGGLKYIRFHTTALCSPTRGEGRISRTHAFFFSMDETMEIGCDVGEPVSPDYGPRGNAFSGTVKWVQIDIDAAAKDADHMIGAEERFKLAVARQ